jgi:hypothetical protein
MTARPAYDDATCPRCCLPWHKGDLIRSRGWVDDGCYGFCHDDCPPPSAGTRVRLPSDPFPPDITPYDLTQSNRPHDPAVQRRLFPHVYGSADDDAPTKRGGSATAPCPTLRGRCEICGQPTTGGTVTFAIEGRTRVIPTCDSCHEEMWLILWKPIIGLGGATDSYDDALRRRT